MFIELICEIIVKHTSLVDSADQAPGSRKILYLSLKFTITYKFFICHKWINGISCK